MSVLEFGPRKFYQTRNQIITRDGIPVGAIGCAWIGEWATITTGGASFTAARDDSTGNGGFYLEGNGARIADAQKGSTRLFTVQAGGKAYSLKAASPFATDFILIEGGKQIGSIAPKGLYSLKSVAGLPDDLTLEVKAFLFWLVFILRRRSRTFLGQIGSSPKPRSSPIGGRQGNTDLDTEANTVAIEHIKLPSAQLA